MAACRDLPLPVAIVCLVLIRFCSPLPTATEVVATKTSSLPPDDYYDDVTVTTPQAVPPASGDPPKQCNYDRCLEGQTPCADLAASTGCWCPGFTLHNVRPNAPSLKSASWNGSEVVVHWCAPYSYVTGFNVTVGAQKVWKFGKDRRSGGIGKVEHVSEICVVAVNDVGNSDGSCMMYQPRDSSLALKAGLIGGALGFLLLLLLAVLLWRHKRQRKQEASISMYDGAGTQ